MKPRKFKKKVEIRQRILAAFSAVLFFSFALTWIIFSVALNLLRPIADYYPVYEQGFFGRPAVVLFGSIGIMFVVAVVVTYFLAKSFTRPIEKLRKFALGIGPGNFAPNDFEFNEKELCDLNAALNASAKQLGVYDSEQKTFFQNASHELRTPLMSIKCYAEGISFGLMDPKQASETILQETDKLSELVADLLYISKIDNIATAYNATDVDLASIIRDCAGRQQAMADKGQIKFTFNFDDDAMPHKCVHELISRAVDNLISNALRYAASEITLSCHKKAGHVEISVSDDGNGIDPEILPHVFERFYKGNGGNTGIGLSIVKSIAEQHGGHVTAINANKGGAVFTVALPIT
ncbi:MAG: HAMP domain-containing histidine kinase [Defluviitaleaceae bacterium]|nr:HAMP domain-containing histidine kinase [Defluviitaleaceae bacterium]